MVMHQTVCACEDPLCPADRARGFDFYVTVRDGSKWAALLGPYDTHEAALADVETARALACEANARAHWFAFGTARRAAELPKLKAVFAGGESKWMKS